MAGRPIDEKIVAMKMDISDLKKKAMDSTSIFGKLQSGIDKVKGVNLSKIADSFGGIQRAANRTDLGGLASSVDTIASRFSNLGVVATTTLMNITNRATDAALNMWQGLTTRPVMDGFREYETKIGSIQTILANTQSDGTKLADVKKSLEDLNTYADKTIYNFGEMTRNIGLFTNAGLGLEESTSMIKGFSNAAAASGANSEAAGRAAYQLSQGLSSGSIIQQDWMSLTNAGMGNDNMKRDLIAIGHATGGLKKQYDADYMVQNWKNELTDQRWLTADIMSIYLRAMAGDLDQATLMSEGLTEAQAALLVQNAKTGEEAATKVRTFTQLMDTMKESVGSGWATSFELIFGDFDQATKLWSGISDITGPIINKQSEMRNKLLKDVFREGDGLKNLFGGVKNILAPIGQVLGSIGAGFRKAFPPTNATAVLGLLEGFKNLTSGLRLSEGSVKNLQTIFAGFFSIFAIGWKIVKGAVSVVIGLLPSFSGLGAKILELIAKVAKLPLAFNDASSSGDAFAAAMSVVKKVVDVIAKVLEVGVGGLILFVDAVTTAIGILASGDFSGGPWEEDSVITDKLLKIRDVVLLVVSGIQQGWSILTNGNFSGGPWDQDSKIVGFLSKVKTGFGGMKESIAGIDFKAIGGSFIDFIGAIKDGFGWVIDKAMALGSAIKNALPNGNELMAGGVIAAMVTIVGFVLKTAWDIKEVFTGWGQIGGGITEVLEGAGSALESFGLQVKAQALLTIAIAVGVLAASFWALSGLDVNDIAKGLYAIIGSLSAIVLAMHVMTKYDITGTGLKAAVQIVALSIAFAILSGAIKKIADLSWEEIGKGLVGLIGIMGTFSLAIIAMSKFGGGGAVGASALQFLAIAAAMHILFGVVEKMGGIDTGVLVKGVSTLGIILLQLALFLKISSGAKFGPGATIGILAIGAAIMGIVLAIQMISAIDTNVLVKGLSVITIILAQVVLFAKLTSGTGLATSSVGLALVAASLLLMTVPISILGNMDMATLGIGLGAIAIALVAIGAASKLMTGTALAGVGIALIAASLLLLLIPITAFGAMSWGVLLKGMTGLALSLLILGGAALLLAPAVVPMIALGAAIALLGIGMAAAGLGIALFSTGLVTMATMTGTAVITITAMLGTMIVSLAALIPAGVDFVMKIIQHMASALEANAPVLATKMSNMVIKMLDVITEKMPYFIESATNLIVAFITGMEESLPRIIEAGANLITTLMVSLSEAVVTNGPIFLAAWMNLMAEVAVIMVTAGIAMVQALFGWIPGVMDATNQIAESAETGIRDAFDAAAVGANKGDEFNKNLSSKTGGANKAGQNVAKGAETGVKSADTASVGSDKGDDFASSLASRVGAAQASGSNLATGAETGTGTADLLSIGGAEGSDFASGLASKISAASTSGSGLARAGETGASSVDLTSAGANFGQGFANGMSSKFDTIVNVGKGLAAAASGAIEKWLDIRSPSRVTTKSGEHTGQGFANGIANKKKEAAKSAKTVAATAKKEFNKDMDNAEYRFKMGKIDSKGYISELRKIKTEYAKHPELVKKANLEIKAAEKDASKHREKLKKKDEDARKKAFDDEKRRIDDLKYYGKLSLEQELKFWQNTQKKYKAGSEQRREADREVFRLKNDISQKALDNEKKRIDELDYYGKLTLEQELKYYQDLSKKHKAGSDERKAADREVYRVKNEISQKALDDEKKRIDELQYYGKLTQEAELKYYEDLVKKHKAGSDERKAAEREVYRVKKEISQKILDDEKERLAKEKEAIDDKKYYNQLSIMEELKAMQKLNAEYKKGSDERKATEKEIYRLKNEINKQLMAISDDYNSKVKEANKKLIDGEKQLTQEYENAVSDRAKSLAGFTNIFDKVAKANKVSGGTLMKNLRGQVQAFSEWSVSIEELSKRGIDEGLMEQLRDMGPQSAGEIKALNSMTDEQLKEYAGLWKTKNQLARTESEVQLQGMKSDTARKIEELRRETADQLEVYKTEWLEKIRQIREGTENEFIPLKASMHAVGADSIKGLMEGLDELTPELMAQAKAIAEAVAATIRAALEINSPSRVTTRFGEFVSQGLAIGMKNDIGRVISSAANVANAAKDTLSTMLDSILPPDNTIELNVNMNTDGIDLERVKVPVEYIPDTSFTNGLASSTLDSMKRQNDSKRPKEVTRDVEPVQSIPNINQTLNFHTKEMTPSEVARKNRQATRQLAMEFRR